MGHAIAGIIIPDSKLACEAAQLVKETESTLLFNHSTRVFLFGALAGTRNKLKFDTELLYIGAMFHDMGLTTKYSSQQERFEVDSANAARDFFAVARLQKSSLILFGTQSLFIGLQVFLSTKSLKWLWSRPVSTLMF